MISPSNDAHEWLSNCGIKHLILWRIAIEFKARVSETPKIILRIHPQLRHFVTQFITIVAISKNIFCVDQSPDWCPSVYRFFVQSYNHIVYRTVLHDPYWTGADQSMVKFTALIHSIATILFSDNSFTHWPAWGTVVNAKMCASVCRAR